MSCEALCVAWGASLPPAPKLVLLAIADQASELQSAASTSSIARRCNMSAEEVQHWVYWLAEQQRINIVPDAGMPLYELIDPDLIAA